jgi:hypothetical protein
MKRNYTLTLKGMLLSTLLVFTSFTYAQTQTLSREELALQKAEDKLEKSRLKLVEVKRDIESADSLFVAGEELEKSGVVRKAEAKDEIKAIEKTFKAESKPAQKMEKNKDRSIAAEGKAEYKELYTQYKTDLKVSQDKLKLAEKDIITAGRMMDKADKKLDMLKSKLKDTEKAYEEAEKALNEKKGIEK